MRLLTHDLAGRRLRRFSAASFPFPETAMTAVAALARPPADAAAPLRGTTRLDDTSELAWQSWGPAGAPVVLVMGGLSADRNCGGLPGAWWDAQCGPGKALDPGRLQLLGVDWLDRDGSGRPIGSDTQAAALVALLDALGIGHLHLAIGASWGGAVAQQLACRLGSRLGHALIVAAAHRPAPWAGALRRIQREIVEQAPESRRALALAQARRLAILGYRTPEDLALRFDTADDAAAWLDHHGRRFAASFDADRFLRLSAALDAHHCEPERIGVPTTLVAIRDDLLVPPGLMREFAQRIGAPVRLAEIASVHGHDAFLADSRAMAAVLSAALARGAPA
jgi:homoserine O-acetyltransferase